MRCRCRRVCSLWSVLTLLSTSFLVWWTVVVDEKDDGKNVAFVRVFIHRSSDESISTGGRSDGRGGEEAESVDEERDITQQQERFVLLRKFHQSSSFFGGHSHKALSDAVDDNNAEATTAGAMVFAENGDAAAEKYSVEETEPGLSSGSSSPRADEVDAGHDQIHYDKNMLDPAAALVSDESHRVRTAQSTFRSAKYQEPFFYTTSKKQPYQQKMPIEVPASDDRGSTTSAGDSRASDGNDGNKERKAGSSNLNSRTFYVKGSNTVKKTLRVRRIKVFEDEVGEAGQEDTTGNVASKAKAPRKQLPRRALSPQNLCPQGVANLEKQARTRTVPASNIFVPIPPGDKAEKEFRESVFAETYNESLFPRSARNKGSKATASATVSSSISDRVKNKASPGAGVVDESTRATTRHHDQASTRRPHVVDNHDPLNQNQPRVTLFDHAAQDASVALISKFLEEKKILQRGSPTLLSAYLELNPRAFRKDVWAVALLYFCGGLTLDAKMFRPPFTNEDERFTQYKRPSVEPNAVASGASERLNDVEGGGFQLRPLLENFFEFQTLGDVTRGRSKQVGDDRDEEQEIGRGHQEQGPKTKNGTKGRSAKVPRHQRQPQSTNPRLPPRNHFSQRRPGEVAICYDFPWHDHRTVMRHKTTTSTSKTKNPLQLIFLQNAIWATYPRNPALLFILQQQIWNIFQHSYGEQISREFFRAHKLLAYSSLVEDKAANVGPRPHLGGGHGRAQLRALSSSSTGDIGGNGVLEKTNSKMVNSTALAAGVVSGIHLGRNFTKEREEQQARWKKFEQAKRDEVFGYLSITGPGAFAQGLFRSACLRKTFLPRCVAEWNIPGVREQVCDAAVKMHSNDPARGSSSSRTEAEHRTSFAAGSSAGDDTSRAPDERRGPFVTEDDVLEKRELCKAVQKKEVLWYFATFAKEYQKRFMAGLVGLGGEDVEEKWNASSCDHSQLMREFYAADFKKQDHATDFTNHLALPGGRSGTRAAGRGGTSTTRQGARGHVTGAGRGASDVNPNKIAAVELLLDFRSDIYLHKKVDFAKNLLIASSMSTWRRHHTAYDEATLQTSKNKGREKGFENKDKSFSGRAGALSAVVKDGEQGGNSAHANKVLRGAPGLVQTSVLRPSSAVAARATTARKASLRRFFKARMQADEGGDDKKNRNTHKRSRPPDELPAGVWPPGVCSTWNAIVFYGELYCHEVEHCPQACGETDGTLQKLGLLHKLPTTSDRPHFHQRSRDQEAGSGSREQEVEEIENGKNPSARLDVAEAGTPATTLGDSQGAEPPLPASTSATGDSAATGFSSMTSWLSDWAFGGQKEEEQDPPGASEVVQEEPLAPSPSRGVESRPASASGAPPR
ncbi:unnamed protein product [Amoebophrya sp. A120]|nr:unnamed protein product [Amoebophrya sp. A120]|eukprot:GSA120T00005844001.1